MKSPRLMFSVAFALFVLLTSAVAQTGTIRVSVPFAFTVGSQALAGGDYTVSSSGSLLRLARIDGPGVATVSTNLTGGGPNENLTPRLIFHCYGNRRFLSVAWIGEMNQGHELYASAAELEFARTTRQDRAVVLASRSPNR